MAIPLSCLLPTEVQQHLLDVAQRLPENRSLGTVTITYATNVGSDTLHHQQVFQAGKLVTWEVVAPTEFSCAVVHAAPDDALRFALGMLQGAEGCDATRLRIRTHQGHREVPAPPAHLADAVGKSLGPRIPYADVVTQLSVKATPFGVLDYWLGFVEGQLSDWQWGWHPSPDVRLDPTLAQVIAFHNGSGTLIDLIAGTQLDNIDWTHAMLAGGLIDSREFHAAWAQHWNPSVGRLMSATGTLMASDTFAAFRECARDLVLSSGTRSPVDVV